MNNSSKKKSKIITSPNSNYKKQTKFYNKNSNSESKSFFVKSTLNKKYKNNKKCETFEESFKNKNDNEGIRLNKFISNAGICSRRQADMYISAGNVTVNGAVVTTLGYKVMPSDNIKFGSNIVRSQKKEYLILNKPKNFITTMKDEKGRKTVMDLVSNSTKNRLYPVGRLDRNTLGVLLFTNDGELSKKLTHPSYEIKKMYHVFLNKSLKSEDFKAIEEGVVLKDGVLNVNEISYVIGARKSEVGITIHSGKNRIVRRLFEYLGYEVKKLDRISFGGITKKGLKRGQWRFLTEKEIGFLKMLPK